MTGWPQAKNCADHHLVGRCGPMTHRAPTGDQAQHRTRREAVGDLCTSSQPAERGLPQQTGLGMHADFARKG